MEDPTKQHSLAKYVHTCVPVEFRYWLLHQRGYSDRFNWLGPDREGAKRAKERHIVDEWAAAHYRDPNACPYVQLESCAPPLPDCQLIDRAGRKIGVEVTELVDQDTIKRNKYTSYQWKEYSANELFSAVATRLMTKNQKFQSASVVIRDAGFHKIIVILHCDEPDLGSRPAFCRDVLCSQMFSRLSEIDEAYLLLPCPRKTNVHDFEAEFCQLTRIPLASRE